jgi:hypothetical protein
MIESNQSKKPIPPGLKPIQPGERHQSASGSGFLYWRNFSPIAARTSGEASLQAISKKPRRLSTHRMWFAFSYPILAPRSISLTHPSNRV